MAFENLITDHLDLWTAAVRPKSSAGRGSNSKLELTGIKKLRELILELAVRGKLVPQDPSDEPASVLLERIAAEKARLVKEGKIKKPKALPEISEEDKPFELPEGWEWQRLGAIGFTQTGGTPSKSSQEYFGNDIPFIKPGDISDTSVIYGNEGLSTLGAEKLGRLAPSGSILMVCIGTIGKCNKIDRLCAFNQQINSVTPYVEIYDFLHKCLSSSYFQALAWENSSSTTIAILNKGKWEVQPVPLPPISEQHRIVAKVDELMALCDQLEQRSESQLAAHQTLVETLLATLTDSADAYELAQNWARLSTHFDTLFTTEASIDALKQTILQLAVMGKLVPQDPSDEPANKLIGRMNKYLCEKGKTSLSKLKRDKSVVDPNEFFHSNPEGWEWVELQEISLFLNGKAHEQFIDDNGRFILVNSKFVSNSGAVKKFIAERLTPLNKGDIAIVMSDVPNGRALARCYLVEEDDKYSLNQRIGAIITDPELDRDYLVLALNRNPYMLSYDDGKKQTNLKKIQVLSTPIPIPPVEEQKRIVVKVNELIALCNQLKVSLQTSQQTQLALAETLVEGVLA